MKKAIQINRAQLSVSHTVISKRSLIYERNDSSAPAGMFHSQLPSPKRSVKCINANLPAATARVRSS